MTSAHNSYRLHALGPSGLSEPDCVASPPKVLGFGLRVTAAASLLLKARGVGAAFYGFTGEDGAGSVLRRALMHLPLDLSYYRRYPGPSMLAASADLPASERAAAFFSDRAKNTADWPEASCTQATWIVFDAPAIAALPGLYPPWISRARRRGAFSVVCLDSQGLRDGAYADWDWPEIDLALISGDLEEAHRPQVSHVIFSQDAIRLFSRAGLFGQVKTEFRRKPESDNAAIAGAFLAHLLFEILEEDDIPRSEVHVERERLHMQPLHLGMAMEWALIAESQTLMQGTGIASEATRGAWLRATEQAWKSAHPERFTLWGGRNNASR